MKKIHEVIVKRLKRRTGFHLALFIVFIISVTGLSFFAIGDGFSCLVGSVSAESDGGKEFLFTLMHTNDEHSALIPFGPAVDYHPVEKNATLGGFARLATVVADIRAEKEWNGEPTLLVSAGDHIGGTIFGWLIPEGYAPEISLMQMIGYDLVALGNHEFDYGPELLADYYKKAGYPAAHHTTELLSSNVIPPEGHPLLEIEIRRTVIKELSNGLKVGFFGLLGNDAHNEAPFFEPMEHKDAFETARECIKELKEEGADVIVALTHSGIREDRELAKKVDGIHLIVGGHDHYGTEEPEQIKDTYIVQAQNFLRYLGVLELSYNSGTDKLTLRNKESKRPFLLPVEYPVIPHVLVEQEVGYYTDRLNELVYEYTDGLYTNIFDAVMYSDFPLYASRSDMRELELGNFLTDAMRLVAGEIMGKEVDFAFQATGVIRAEVRQGTMNHSMSKISFYDLLGASPLGTGNDGIPGYPLAAAYLTGEDIYKILEISSLLSEYLGYEYFMQISGLRYQYDRKRTIYFRLPGGTPIPSTSSVMRAERYRKADLQTGEDEDYEIIPDDDSKLYLVVTDYALLTAIPLVAERIPWLKITPKDEDGNEVQDMTELIVMRQEKELKVWQALLIHAGNQLPGGDYNAWLSDYYLSYGDRIIEVDGPSLWTWPIIILFLIVGLIVFLIIWRRGYRISIQVEE